MHVEDDGYRMARASLAARATMVDQALRDGHRVGPHGIPLLSLAEHVARIAHFGQVDGQGRDYHEYHLRPVVQRLRVFGADNVAIAAGWLHGLIERTDFTAATLRIAGVPEDVVDIVEAMTRRPDEAYRDYIDRVAAHPRAREGKLACNAVNLGGLDDLAKLGPQQAADAARLRPRYVQARTVLVAAECAATT